MLIFLFWLIDLWVLLLCIFSIAQLLISSSNIETSLTKRFHRRYRSLPPSFHREGRPACAYTDALWSSAVVYTDALWVRRPHIPTHYWARPSRCRQMIGYRVLPRIINFRGPVTGVSNPVYWSPGALNSSIGSSVGSVAVAAFSTGLGVSTG